MSASSIHPVSFLCVNLQHVVITYVFFLKIVFVFFVSCSILTVVSMWSMAGVLLYLCLALIVNVFINE